jgi:hypothetical protein
MSLALFFLVLVGVVFNIFLSFFYALDFPPKEMGHLIYCCDYVVCQ